MGGKYRVKMYGKSRKYLYFQWLRTDQPKPRKACFGSNPRYPGVIRFQRGHWICHTHRV